MRRKIPEWIKDSSWVWALGYTFFYWPLFFASDQELYIFLCIFFWALSAFLYYLDRGQKKQYEKEETEED